MKAMNRQLLIIGFPNRSSPCLANFALGLHGKVSSPCMPAPRWAKFANTFNVFCTSVCSVRSKFWFILGFLGHDTPFIGG